MADQNQNEHELSFEAHNDVAKLVICVVKHPFDLAKTLIQIGYEPLPSFPTRNIFGRPKIGLPGALSYLGFVFRHEGVTGIFRGLPYNVIDYFSYRYTYNYIEKNVGKYCPYLQITTPDLSEDSAEVTTTEYQPAPNLIIKLHKDGRRQNVPIDFSSSFDELTRVVARDGLCITGALVASYPFHVLLIRNFASFVGKETVYDFPFSAIKDIVNNEGLLGFYSGFVPRLIGELSCLVVTKSIIILLIKPYCNTPEYSSILTTIVNFIVPAVLYPFNLVSTVMAVNGCKSIQAANLEPEFISWTECWNHLSSMGNLKRGSSIIWRFQTLPPSGTPPRPDGFSSYGSLKKSW